MSRPRKTIHAADALPPPPEYHYTPLQIAVAHQVSVATVIGYIEAGELSARKPGKEYRVPVSAYQRWLATTTIRPA